MPERCPVFAKLFHSLERLLLSPYSITPVKTRPRRIAFIQQATPIPGEATSLLRTMVGMTLAGLLGLSGTLHGGATEPDAGPGMSEDAAVPEMIPADPLTPWTIIGEIGGSSEEFLYGTALLAPLWTTPDAVVFLYPGFTGMDSESQIYSLGLGARFLLPGDWGVLGANAFYDRAEYSGLPGFDQVGGGLEYLGHWLEARGNFYLAASGERLFDRQNRSESASFSKSSSSYSLSDPYAIDNRIVQTERVTTRTTRTTITENYFYDRHIQGMDGLDFEGGVRVPTGYDPIQLRLLAGLYHYDNPYGGDLSGFKARAEARLWDRMFLDVAYHEDEEIVGGNWYAGLRVSIPLGRAPVPSSYRGGSTRERLRARLGEPVVRESRVQVADSGYVENESLFRREVESKTTTKSRSSETVLLDDVVFVNNGGDVGNGIQEGGLGADGFDGTAQRPFNTIQEGANTAGVRNVATQRVWNVYTQGAGAHGGMNYVENITLSSSTNFLTSATELEGLGDSIFGTGDRPLVEGGFASSPAVFLPGGTAPTRFGIDGFEITGGYTNGSNPIIQSIVPVVSGGNGVGILSLGTAGVEINNNFISSTGSDAIRVLNPDSNTAAILSNSIADSGGNGIHLIFDQPTAPGAAVVFDNFIGYSNTNGIHVESIDGGIGEVAILLNAVITNPTGIRTTVGIGGQINAEIAGNSVSDSNIAGIAIHLANNADFTGGIDANRLFGGGDGIQAVIGQSSTMTADILDNLILLSGAHGISVSAGFLATLEGDILNNIVTGSTNDGIRVNLDGGGTMAGSILENTVSESGDFGIFVTATAGESAIRSSTFAGDIANNTVIDGAFANTDEAQIAVYLQGGTFSGSANFNGFIRDNTLENSRNNGILAFLTGGGQGGAANFTGGIANNTISDTGMDGITLVALGGADSTATFTGDIADNILENIGENGIRASITGGSGSGNALFSGSITGNTVEQTGTHGIAVGLLGGTILASGNMSGDIADNTIRRTTGNGILVNIAGRDTSANNTLAGSAALLGGVLRNSLSQNTQSGIQVTLVGGDSNHTNGSIAGTASITGGIIRNSLAAIEGSGIQISAQGGNASAPASTAGEVFFLGGIHDNSIANIQESGIAMEFAGGFTNEISAAAGLASFAGGITGNALTNIGNRGIEVGMIGGRRAASVFGGNIENNSLAIITSNGIDLVVAGGTTDGPATFSGLITNNAISIFDGDGIRVRVEGGLGGAFEYSPALFGGAIGNTLSSGLGNGYVQTLLPGPDGNTATISNPPSNTYNNIDGDDEVFLP